MRQLAELVVRAPVEAAAAFRTMAEVKPLGGSVGLLLTFAWWVWTKKRTRLPAYPFIVVTGREVIVLEFTFGATLRMKRVVGRWYKEQVRVVEASPEMRRVTLALPSSRWIADLQGVYGSEAERDVVSRLAELMRN